MHNLKDRIKELVIKEKNYNGNGKGNKVELFNPKEGKAIKKLYVQTNTCSTIWMACYWVGFTLSL